jgi:hypothetical protein
MKNEDNQQQRTKGSAPLPAMIAARLVALVDEVGQGAAADQIGISNVTVRIAYAGGAVSAGSRALIEAALGRDAAKGGAQP